MIIYEDRHGNEILFAEEFTTPESEELLLSLAAPHEHKRLRATFAALHAEEDRLNALATDEQRAIGGDTYCRTTVLLPGEGPVTVYGHIEAEPELVAKERATDQPQFAERVASIFAEGRSKGWVYGIWHSVAEPDGDYGSHHVATLEVITRGEYQRARAAGWQPG